jgi:hypothetical protein
MIIALGADIEQQVVDLCLRSADPEAMAVRAAQVLDRLADRGGVPAEMSDELVRIMGRVLERVRNR